MKRFFALFIRALVLIIAFAGLIWGISLIAQFFNI